VSDSLITLLRQEESSLSRRLDAVRRALSAFDAPPEASTRRHAGDTLTNRVLQIARDSGPSGFHASKATSLFAATSKTPSQSASITLARLVSRGELVKVSRGWYRLANMSHEVVQ
jgi:hypothetical protein